MSLTLQKNTYNKKQSSKYEPELPSILTKKNV